ncbi:MAG: hypothetical protein HOP19_10505 [Acidobacteria bacterium]|nr:hypothetical protein [Acidobacteriota bacterium]
MEETTTPYEFKGEWDSFNANHPLFTEKLPTLKQVLRKVFVRTFGEVDPTNAVIFTLGSQCLDEFMEILLLCASGLGFGGLKLLRGLYERAVTTQYLATFPQDINRFLDYNDIHLGKFFNHADREYDVSTILSEENVEAIKAAYTEAKKRFQITDCRKCGTTRLASSWSELDVLSMAKKAQGSGNLGFYDLYGSCYILPTMQLHTTAFSFSGLVEENDLDFSFKSDAYRDAAQRALIGAHNIIILVLKIQSNFFKLDLDSEIDALGKDFLEIWQGRQA